MWALAPDLLVLLAAALTLARRGNFISGHAAVFDLVLIFDGPAQLAVGAVVVVHDAPVKSIDRQCRRRLVPRLVRFLNERRT